MGGALELTSTCLSHRLPSVQNGPTDEANETLPTWFKESGSKVQGS